MLSFGSAPVSNCARGNSSKLPDYLPEEDDDVPVISDKVRQFFLFKCTNHNWTETVATLGPTQSIRLIVPLIKTSISIQNITISNKIVIVKHKKMLNAPFQKYC